MASSISNKSHGSYVKTKKDFVPPDSGKEQRKAPNVFSDAFCFICRNFVLMGDFVERNFDRLNNAPSYSDQMDRQMKKYLSTLCTFFGFVTSFCTIRQQCCTLAIFAPIYLWHTGTHLWHICTIKTFRYHT